MTFPGFCDDFAQSDSTVSQRGTVIIAVEQQDSQHSQHFRWLNLCDIDCGQKPVKKQNKTWECFHAAAGMCVFCLWPTWQCKGPQKQKGG